MLVNSVTAQDRIIFTLSPGNYAYKGFANTFTYNNPDKKKVIFSCQKGRIEEKGDSYLFYASEHDTSVIYVYNISTKDTVLVYSQKIVIKKVPDPSIAIRGVEITSETSRQMFENVNTLEGFLDIDIVTLKTAFIVRSFDLTIKSPNTKTFVSSTNAFTDEMKSALKRLKPGDSVWFENVIEYGPDGTTRYLGHTVKTRINEGMGE